MGKGLTIDFGKFVTPAGAEVIENKDNFNYSRGLLFALAIPYYHAGFRVGYAVNDKVSVTGYLVNGWNNVIENNGDKTVGVSLGLKPNAKTGVFVNYLVGKEFASERRRRRHPQPARHRRQPMRSTTRPACSPTSTTAATTSTARPWTGTAWRWALKYQATDKFAVSPRYEWFVDDDGFATGLAQTLQEITLTGEYKATGGLITRFEFRSDFSDEDYFIKDDGLKSSQPTASVSFIYAFSSK